MLRRVVHKSTAGFLEQPHRLWALWTTRLWVLGVRVHRPPSAGLELQRDAVNGAKLDRSKVHCGVTVIIFMQANHFTDQWLGDENQLALPFNLAVAAHPAQFEVAGIGRIFEAGRIGS